MNAHVPHPSRRAFLIGAAGLVVGVYLPRLGRADAEGHAEAQGEPAGRSGADDEGPARQLGRVTGDRLFHGKPPRA